MLALKEAGGIIFTSIMPGTTCNNCGAEIADGTRFCRRCGHPSAALSQADSSEAPTRTFETSPPTAPSSAATQFFSSEPTGPAYLAPNVIGAAPETSSAQTNRSLQAPTRNRSLVMFSAIGGTVLVVLVALMMGWMVWRSVASTVRREMIRIEPPPPPVIGHPPLPPIPHGEGGAISRSLIYPGAEVVMDMTRGDEGGVLQLNTRDPLDKVVDWYTAKLRPAKKIILPGKNAVLRGGGITAIITGSEEGQTSIVIKQEP